MKLTLYVTPYSLDIHQDGCQQEFSYRGCITRTQCAEGPVGVAEALTRILHQCGIAVETEWSRSYQPVSER